MLSLAILTRFLAHILAESEVKFINHDVCVPEAVKSIAYAVVNAPERLISIHDAPEVESSSILIKSSVLAHVHVNTNALPHTFVSITTDIASPVEAAVL